MNFDDILARCIDAIEHGATVEECLMRYPAQAAALEPLLTMVVRLSRAPKTQLSSQAFNQGRAALAAHIRQRWAAQNHTAVQHRRLAPIPTRRSQRFPGSHNGTLPQHHSWALRRSRPRLGISHLLGLTLLLLLLVSGATVARHVVFSLPGTPFYSVKRTGEQVVEILMEAAGEEITWHASQTERYLHALARLPQQDTATAQTLSHAIEEHWAAVLAAAQLLPIEERVAVLQARIAHLQQLETTWAAPQDAVSTVATTTVRKLIKAGEQSLHEPQAMDTLATLTPTATLTPMPTATLTEQPTDTATPLLQATAQPVLVASATPTEAPTTVPIVTVAPATATPLPPTMTPSATPRPEITAVIPRQETQHNQSDSSDNDDDDESAESEAPSSADEPEVSTSDPATNAPTTSAERPINNTTTVTNITVTNTVVAVDETPDLDPTQEQPVETEGAVVTPLPTAAGEQPVPTAEATTPHATTTVEPPAVVTKTTPQATATSGELPATNTPGPKATSQPVPTKPPKPTATHADNETEEPVATDAPTPTEKTPAPITPPTADASPVLQEATISAPATPLPNPSSTPRPPTPSGEATKAVHP